MTFCCDFTIKTVNQSAISTLHSTIHFPSRSKAMQKYNKVVEKGTDLLLQENPEITNEMALKVVTQGLDRRMRRRSNKRKMENVCSSQAPNQQLNVVNDNCMNRPVTCNAQAQYRTIDGRCNNLNNPYWGAMSTPFRRNLAAIYADNKANYNSFSHLALKEDILFGRFCVRAVPFFE